MVDAPLVLQKAPAIFDGGVPTKFGVSIVVFLVSLFAVSFPSLSKRVKYLRIPSVIFFLGKHFGTGVILSTAFVHLLPDAFDSLQSRWTGLVVLLALVSIFIVEYISTAYVDHLHSTPSAPPSPTPSTKSRAASVCSSTAHEDSPHIPKTITPPSSSSPPPPVSETTPLILSQGDDATALVVHAGPVDEIFGGGHHRFESRATHRTHSSTVRGKKVSAVALFDAEGRLYGTGDVVDAVPLPAELAHPPHTHAHSHSHISDAPRPKTQRQRSCAQSHGGHGHGHGHGHGGHLHMDTWHPADEEAGEDEEPTEEMQIGRRRQIVGILMLQIGIMLHSLVIGLTLSITRGPEFTTLVTAILFHQLFEGLSLGIRIAVLPSAARDGAFARLPGHILKPVLAGAFALTVPAGIALGLAAFAGHGARDHARLTRIQGFMSAMSAGMLIYAACVEMLAGDFVMDPMMWRSSVRRQVMALVSLFLGVCAMAFVGH